MAERPKSELSNMISYFTLEANGHRVHGRIGSDQDLEFHHRGPTLGKMLVRAKVFQTNRTKLILFRVRMFSSDVEKESFCPHLYKFLSLVF